MKVNSHKPNAMVAISMVTLLVLSVVGLALSFGTDSTVSAVSVGLSSGGSQPEMPATARQLVEPSNDDDGVVARRGDSPQASAPVVERDPAETGVIANASPAQAAQGADDGSTYTNPSDVEDDTIELSSQQLGRPSGASSDRPSESAAPAAAAAPAPVAQAAASSNASPSNSSSSNGSNSSRPNQAANTTPSSAAPSSTSAPRATTAPTTSSAPSTTAANSTADLFVSTSGSDRSNGGSRNNPLRTPSYAARIAESGDVIHILPGDYEPLEISGKNGLTVAAPQGGVTLSSGTYEQKAGVLVEDSRNIVIDGLRTEHSLWGIRVFASHGVVVRNNEVIDTGQEAIHVLARSTDVTIQGNLVDITGQRSGSRDGLEFRDRGEGIYLGTGGSFQGGVDNVSNVRIIGNTVRNVTAEAVEIKASVSNVVVRGNLIHNVDVHSGAAVSIGRGTRTYDANVIVENNAIWNVTSRRSSADGIGVRVSSPATVRNNAIWNVEHFGVRVDDQLRNVNGSVTVSGNLIFGAGIDEVRNEAGSTGVPVSISGTIEGSAATSTLNQLGQSASSPSPRALLNHLS